MTVTILGRPFSKKNSRRIFGSGAFKRNLPSKAYEGFEKEAINQLIRLGLTKLSGFDEKRRPIYKSPVAISNKCAINYTFHLRGAGNQDGDNIQSGINDILQKAGILLNDRQMRKWSAEIIEGSKEWYTEVEIIEL